MARNSRPNLTECLLGAGSSVSGTLSGQGVVRVEGQFEGSIQAHDAVILSKDAKVKAEISAKDVFIAGKFSGTIEATGVVRIVSGAIVEADIQATALELAAGASYNGHFKRTVT